MRKYMIRYKDRSGFGVGEEMTAMGEHEAVQLLQSQLIDEDDYMTELVSVEEIDPDEEEYHYGKDEPVWSIKDGPELDQESQDTLNYAFENMVNEDGMTLKQTFDKEIEDNK